MSGGARPIASLNPSWLIENYAEPMLVTHLFTHTGGPLCSCWILGRPNATMMVWSDTKPGFDPPGFGPFRTNFLLFAQFCITKTEKNKQLMTMYKECLCKNICMRNFSFSSINIINTHILSRGLEWPRLRLDADAQVRVEMYPAAAVRAENSSCGPIHCN